MHTAALHSPTRAWQVRALVRTRREAQTIWYSIASPAAERIIRTLYELYCAGDDAGPAPGPKP